MLSQLPPLQLLEQVVATAIIGHDQTYLERPCVRRRAIQVNTTEVGIVEFDVGEGKREEVIANDERAARAFLAGWKWQRFKQDCRGLPQDAAAISANPRATQPVAGSAQVSGR